MSDRKVLPSWPLFLSVLICIASLPAETIANPCLDGEVYLNGVCSVPGNVAPSSLCPNAPISPTVVAPSAPSIPTCPNAPVSPTVVAPCAPSSAPCPNAPVSPTVVAPCAPSTAPCSNAPNNAIVVVPSNPPCTNSPTGCGSSTTTCTTNCVTSSPTPCQNNNNCVQNPPCSAPSCSNNCGTPSVNSPCPNSPCSNSPCPNSPCPNNPSPTSPCPNSPCSNSPCPNTPCPSNPSPSSPCPSNPYPIYPSPNPITTPPTLIPPTYPPLPPLPTYPPLPPMPTYPPLPPMPTYPPLPPLPTYPPLPPLPTTTTPPPANIVEVRCPEGTIRVNNRCRLLYCGSYGVYAGGRCQQVRCPPGYVWTGHRCSVPQPTELGHIHLENTIYQKSGNLPHLVTNNVNNVKVNASISIQGQTSEEEEEEVEVEVVVPQAPSRPCCQVVAPRTCAAQPDLTYRCFSRSQQQCGSFCSANRMVLVPNAASTWTTEANNQMMVVPANWPAQSCQSTGGVCQQAKNIYDCSGCANGDSSTCSSYCYSYKCSGHNCGYYDQSQYCAQYPGQIGCRPSEGWFPTG